MRCIVNIYYHLCKRSTKSGSSFPAPGKSVKENSDVCYGKNNHWIKGGQRKYGGYQKTIKFFMKNVTVPFILNVSKYFMKSNFTLWLTRIKIFNKTLHFETTFTRAISFWSFFTRRNSFFSSLFYFILCNFIVINTIIVAFYYRIFLLDTINLFWPHKCWGRFICTFTFQNIKSQV